MVHLASSLTMSALANCKQAKETLQRNMVGEFLERLSFPSPGKPLSIVDALCTEILLSVDIIQMVPIPVLALLLVFQGTFAQRVSKTSSQDTSKLEPSVKTSSVSPAVILTIIISINVLLAAVFIIIAILRKRAKSRKSVNHLISQEGDIFQVSPGWKSLDIESRLPVHLEAITDINTPEHTFIGIKMNKGNSIPKQESCLVPPQRQSSFFPHFNVGDRHKTLRTVTTYQSSLDQAESCRVPLPFIRDVAIPLRGSSKEEERKRASSFSDVTVLSRSRQCNSILVAKKVKRSSTIASAHTFGHPSDTFLASVSDESASPRIF